MLIEEELNKRLKKLGGGIIVKTSPYFDYLYIYKIRPVEVFKAGKVKIKDKYIRVGKINFKDFYNDLCKVEIYFRGESKLRQREKIFNEIINRIKRKVRRGLKMKTRITDYGKHILHFEDVTTAKYAEKLIENNRKLRTARFYNQLGFASKKSRDKAHKFLLDKGIISIKV